MTAIRPPAWPAIQPKPAPANGRAAFFQAAKSEVTAPAQAAAQPAQALQPIRVEPRGEPQPQKILRPGSLLDIKV